MPAGGAGVLVGRWGQSKAEVGFHKPKTLNARP